MVAPSHACPCWPGLFAPSQRIVIIVGTMPTGIQHAVIIKPHVESSHCRTYVAMRARVTCKTLLEF
jgi:hypothetical protein